MSINKSMTQTNFPAHRIPEFNGRQLKFGSCTGEKDRVNYEIAALEAVNGKLADEEEYRARTSAVS